MAKQLRHARSFYLTVLQDVVAFRLRRELVAHLDAELPHNCLVIDTGGRFALLADLPEVRKAG
ncbi:MAG: hypothetical protein R2911_28355 [Caldilineaceae bacterium]